MFLLLFLIKVSGENLTGLNPAITTRVVFDGGVFIDPIFGDMLATPNNFTQVLSYQIALVTFSIFSQITTLTMDPFNVGILKIFFCNVIITF